MRGLNILIFKLTMNVSNNFTATNATTPKTDQALLMAIGGGFFLPTLLSLYVAHQLFTRSRYALWWDSKNTKACCTCAPSVGLRLYEQVFRCLVCFPKANANTTATDATNSVGTVASTTDTITEGTTADKPSSCCCWSTPKDFYQRHWCQTIWMLVVVLFGCLTPLLLISTVGLLIMYFITPVQIGIGVFCLCWTMVLCLYSFTSYYYNGWHVTQTAKWCLRLSGFLICAYACVAAILIEPLTFTGTSAVAMAFQMFLVVPAMYLVADSNRGVRLSFREWTDAVLKFMQQEWFLDAEFKKIQFDSPIEQLLQVGSNDGGAASTTRAKEDVGKPGEDAAHKEAEQAGSDDDDCTDKYGEKKWMDMAVCSLLSNDQIIENTAALQAKKSVQSTALMYYCVGMLILLGYAFVIYVKATTFWEKPLGFVTMAAVLACKSFLVN